MPPPPGLLLARPRLFRLLDEGVRGRLTIVIGPPGSGKSALLTSWARSWARLDGPLAWLTLDEDDNEQSRLCTHLVAALRQAGGLDGSGEPVELPANAGQADSLPAVVNALDALRTPIVLVLDDFHELRPGPARTAVLQLARHAPAGLRVVLASRREPDLPLHKLRAVRDLAEVRGPELEFTARETGDLFSKAGVALTPDQVAKVLHCSGGWAMGLQLAAITRSEDEDCRTCLEGWSKVIRLCSDFLLRELLETMPAPDQELLLRVSVLSRLNASVVRSITGRADANRILRHLSDEHDLLTREGEWTYRLNPLFRQVLTRELTERFGAEEVVSIHRAACEWYTRQGMAKQAGRHAASAGMPDPFSLTARPVPLRRVVSPSSKDGTAGQDSTGQARESGDEEGGSPGLRPTEAVMPRPGGYDHQLTPTELAVLRLLPDGLTLGEIATRRHVTLNTVKTQVKGIYRKLNVSRRRAAVEAARWQGLI
ncbi:AAA family ATPase [Streptomyces sp. ISL-10]|uniref:helix-turn-helix transcriptional regulator n=1 Tax=Streptomyces sp. ISL-10 TaxID=2819172 RepID=UPI001BE75255|nr:LuxR family transcriptional regulator [Streptomyces sp. ISL-10]MBT2368909.1 AAA family ATPase [Streptomyces sp. ISL-10]